MAEIVERAVRDLVPYARNPRKNDAVVDPMAASKSAARSSGPSQNSLSTAATITGSTNRAGMRSGKARPGIGTGIARRLRCGRLAPKPRKPRPSTARRSPSNACRGPSRINAYKQFYPGERGKRRRKGGSQGASWGDDSGQAGHCRAGNGVFLSRKPGNGLPAPSAGPRERLRP